MFLDRDGTINVEKEYLYKVKDFEFIPGAPEAIRKLKAAGFLVIVVTNQSGVARGYYGLDDVARLHEHMSAELAKHGASVDAFYVCPHHPDARVAELRIECDCRKGAPGMLLRAAAEHGIDLGRSYMVGDKLADIEAGEGAGCSTILVKTGYGKQHAGFLQPDGASICENLDEAVALILATVAGPP